ncbi:LytTR family DNA-binding domain-containing protein [Undibacterium sp. TS12]|uniref:LytR/AlgR family response regulator transcription factor n=1 Tax=Undibacterium sp. TS12 TaxID=2908202 RepID=UPI001F4CC7DC|nr:LytTR family DNA-binding domain-containing protein [Undibacterium sp. TS12]MCH8618971.1 LytTR family DNA-binding domain-containing protein [Undibacterium sp. TS12]
MNPRILIVDDEAPARQRLKTLLSDITEQCPTLVVGEAENAMLALEQIGSLHPDIVLLDVQMPGMNGIELAQHLAQHQLNMRPPAIIFVTAYDEFAVKAFEVHALDYLMKPVRANRLVDAIGRACEKAGSEPHLPPTIAADAGNSRRRHFSVLERGRILLIPVSDVLFLKAEQKYVTLHTIQREYLLEESLTSIELELSELLVRVHRNALVARAAINGVERAVQVVDADGGQEKVSESWQVIVTGCAERLPISRRQWPVIKALVRV